MPESCLSIHLLGTFSLQKGGEKIPLPASVDARRLLVRLILQRRPQSRVILAGQLRPESTEADARRALRQAIWQLNRSLPHQVWSNSEQVGLSGEANLWIDIVEFENLIRPHLNGERSWTQATSDLAQAVGLYQGDLLEGWYDEWILIEREHLRELYLQALERLVLAHKATSRPELALQTALRLTRADPLRESAQREAMRLYHYLGNSAAALKQYETCRVILRQELAIEPDVETQALAQAIAAESAGSGLPYLPQPLQALSGGQQLPLVGRSAELAQLQTWLSMTNPSQGRLILIEGEAGAGKTRLLQEVGRAFEWNGGQVLWGKLTQFEGDRLLDGLVDAITSGLTPLRLEQLGHLVEPYWLQALHTLLPALTVKRAEPLPPLTGEAAWKRQVTALANLLRAWGAITPLLVVVEDLHWASAQTIALLLSLAELLVDSGVVLAASLRHEETISNPELHQRLGALPATYLRGRLLLENLDQMAVRDLVRAALGGSVSPAFQARLQNETHGNPLFILETLRSLHDEGVLRREEHGAWLTPFDAASDEVTLPLPLAVEQVITRRVAQLPARLRDQLEWLAILGGQFDFRLLTELAFTETSDLLAALREFIQRCLLVELPAAYQFQHDKIRQVVYESIPDERARQLHAASGEALERVRPNDIEALANHFYRGWVWHKALRYQRLAAEKAGALFASVSAIKHLNLALEAAEKCQAAPIERFQLLSQRQTFHDILGEREAQLQDLDQMSVLADHDLKRQYEVAYLRAYLLELLCRFGEAETAARQALTLATQLEDKHAQADAWVALGEIICVSYDGRPEAVRDCFHAAEALCDHERDLRQSADIHEHLAWLREPISSFAEIKAHHLKAQELFEKLGEKARLGDQVCDWAGLLHNREGGHPGVEAIYQRALSLAREMGYRRLEGRALNALGNICNIYRVEQAFEYYAGAAAILSAVGDERRAQISRLNSALCRLNTFGDWETARLQARAALEIAQQQEDGWMGSYAEIVLGLADWQCQDGAAAIRWLEHALGWLRLPGGAFLMGEACQVLARVQVGMGQFQAARATLNRVENLARERYWMPMLANIQGERAALALSEGELGPAEQLSALALEVWSPDWDHPWRVPFTRARVLTALGRQTEACQWIEKSYGILQQLLGGMTEEHRALGLRRLPEFAEIFTTAQKCLPQYRQVTILRRNPPPDAPKTVNVRWTISAPEDGPCPDKVTRRRFRLARLLREAQEQGAAPTQQDLANALEVSLRTIAADLVAIRKNLPGK